MQTTYRAVLKGNRLEWREAPPGLSEERPVPVHVTILQDERFSPARGPDTGNRMAAALEKLAASDAVAGIEDPAEWQREARRDRSLPGRD